MISAVRPASRLLLALLVPALVSCSAKVETGDGSTAAAADTVATAEHGKYLVSVLGCHDCHTPGTLYNAPDFNRALSGSELGWTGPWGTSYPRNLTPDIETGIGSWSEDDIVRALQTGRRPDNSELKPPMPWPTYAGLTSRDVHSVAKYLKSIPPVSHANLPVLSPGQKAPAALVFPPPPAWDAPPQAP
jgi:mono/diheme cytochrome c family protein